ncbi:putative transposase-like protein [Cardamine amara subsp. amara]|uniref:Transposase-like protein n=1 Tax=Cardamine amara subsp. amara TaxID=228776 RepID=A0ABD1B095_CARAN
MSDHWNTPDAIERSENASQSRNSDRGGLGPHKHLSGQSSYMNVQQNMEEELGRPVSLGEVFVKTHTRADGTFVDQKAKQVAEAYEKNIEEVMAEMDSDGLETSDHSSQQSTHRTLSIQEKDDIFLKCTETDDKGNHFGLGRLRDTINKGKKRKQCSESSSSASLLEIQQLREEERNNESRIKNLEMLVSYLSTSNPGLAEFIANQAPPTAAASEPSSST